MQRIENEQEEDQQQQKILVGENLREVDKDKPKKVAQPIDRLRKKL